MSSICSRVQLIMIPMIFKVGFRGMLLRYGAVFRELAELCDGSDDGQL